MIPVRMKITEALEQGRNLPYSLIYSLSSVHIGTTRENETMNDEVIEAHFFDEGREIRIINLNGDFVASKIEADNEDCFIEKEYELTQGKGRLTVHEIIEYDSDGQAYISDIQLVRWKGENNQ